MIWSNTSSPDYCLAHKRVERGRGGDYRICFNCNHIFRRETDLIMEYACTWGRAVRGDRIKICPLCVTVFLTLEPPSWAATSRLSRIREWLYRRLGV